MASRRMVIIVICVLLAFVVAVGLESFPLSDSVRSAPQKRGMKNTKVPKRLKTAAKTWVYTKTFIINPYERTQADFHEHRLTNLSLFAT